MMTWWYTTRRWGMDLGTFQLRAQWDRNNSSVFVTDSWCWFFFIWPFEISGRLR
jgi:hypothetical protein